MHGSFSLKLPIQRSMFLNGREPYLHFPKLKAKAAETKHLIPALATVWLQFMDNDSEAPSNQNPLP